MKIKSMDFLLRTLLIVFATLVLTFALVLSSFFVLAAAVRWLFTGQKPSLILYGKAYQHWKHMANKNNYSNDPDEIIIDTEAREVLPKPLNISQKDAD
ncbi:MAG: hypothetical protein ACKO69_09495 [Limnohabitans sp.]